MLVANTILIDPGVGLDPFNRNLHKTLMFSAFYATG